MPGDFSVISKVDVHFTGVNQATCDSFDKPPSRNC
jgi:hypothetical protein